jgi:hypothetical protein
MSNAEIDRRAGFRRVRQMAALAPRVALPIAVFFLAYSLTAALNAAGALRFIDLLFDADSGWFLLGFSNGTGTGTAWGARSLVHPNAANFVHPVVRLASDVWLLTGWSSLSEAALRERVALMVAPVFVAAESVFVYAAAHNLFRSVGLAALVTLLNLALLPTLVFGAIPESFALSGCGFAALFWLVSRVAIGRQPRALSWGAVGVFLAGVTITNLAPFAIAHALSLNTGGFEWRRTLAKTARMCGAVTACTAAAAAVVAGALGFLGDYRHAEFQQLAEVRAPRDQLRERQWLASVGGQAAIIASRTLVAFPVALGHSILPPEPSVEKLPEEHAPGRSRNPLEASTRITFRDRGADWGTFISVAVLAGAVMALVRMRTGARLLYLAAATLLAYNWAFHAVFGVELFLYSKHWTLPMVFVLAAWLEGKWCPRPIGVAVVGAVLVLAAVRSGSALAVIRAAVS